MRKYSLQTGEILRMVQETDYKSLIPAWRRSVEGRSLRRGVQRRVNPMESLWVGRNPSSRSYVRRLRLDYLVFFSLCSVFFIRAGYFCFLLGCGLKGYWFFSVFNISSRVLVSTKRILPFFEGLKILHSRVIGFPQSFLKFTSKRKKRIIAGECAPFAANPGILLK